MKFINLLALPKKPPTPEGLQLLQQYENYAKLLNLFQILRKWSLHSFHIFAMQNNLNMSPYKAKELLR